MYLKIKYEARIQTRNEYIYNMYYYVGDGPRYIQYQSNE